MSLKFIEKDVELNDVHFWLDNPRVPFDPNFGDQEIINHYMKYEKLAKLKQSIKEEGLLEGEFLCFIDPYNNLVTYDGNRRLAAIKSLVNEGYVWNQKLKVKVYHKEDDIFNAVLIKHGTGGGASRRGWQPLQRDRFNYRSHNKLSYPKAFEVILQSGKKITDSKLKNYIEYTTLERILGYECVREELSKLSINHHLNVMFELAKKKISVSNVKNAKDFKKNYYEEFVMIVNNYILKDNIKQIKFDIEEVPTFEQEKGVNKNIETKNVEKNKLEDSMTNVTNTENRSTEKANYVANNKSQQVYYFFDYSNMSRPRFEKSSLSNFLEEVRNMKINTKNLETHLPIGMYFRPILEAHIELLILELKKSSYDKNKLGTPNKIDIYNNFIGLTVGKSVCTENNLKLIVDVAKSLNLINKGEINLGYIDDMLPKIHEFNHGKKFREQHAELIKYDKFIKQYIGIIYSIISNVRR